MTTLYTSKLKFDHGWTIMDRIRSANDLILVVQNLNDCPVQSLVTAIISVVNFHRIYRNDISEMDNPPLLTITISTVGAGLWIAIVSFIWRPVIIIGRLIGRLVKSIIHS